MISDLLLAADLVDAATNPNRSIEDHENGAARLVMLAAHGAHLQALSFEDAAPTQVDLLPGHIWRWALDEAKRALPQEFPPRLPEPELFDRLFAAETDRVSRLLMVESVVTHPEVEGQFSEMERPGPPIPLQRLPNVWPRDLLVRLSRPTGPDGKTERRENGADLLELGMMLLQIATPASLALLGGTIRTLRESGREEHPLTQFVQQFVDTDDEDLVIRLGIRRRGDNNR